jgi:hypothetical protein
LAANKVFLGLLPLLLLALPLLVAACAETSSAFNKPHRGRTLDVSMVSLDRVPELRYRLTHLGEDGEPVTRHYRIAPSSPDMELVLLRLKVENHTATSAVVNIDEQAAELRDFFQGSYRPVNVRERVEQVSAPENPGNERQLICPVGDRQLDRRTIGCFLWNAANEEGGTQAFVLQRGHGLDGWMVFETPQDTRFRELRWRAGDSLTIQF